MLPYFSPFCNDRCYKAIEHWMRTIRPGFELGMELTGQEERMINTLDYFYQIFIWIYACSPDSPCFVLITVRVVAFTAVAVALYNLSRSINFCRQTSLF